MRTMRSFEAERFRFLGGRQRKAFSSLGFDFWAELIRRGQMVPLELFVLLLYALYGLYLMNCEEYDIYTFG